MQDTGGTMRDGYPILHWTLWNIPANVAKLEVGMTPTGNPPGSSYGPTGLPPQSMYSHAR